MGTEWLTNGAMYKPVLGLPHYGRFTNHYLLINHDLLNNRFPNHYGGYLLTIIGVFTNHCLMHNLEIVFLKLALLQGLPHPGCCRWSLKLFPKTPLQPGPSWALKFLIWASEASPEVAGQREPKGIATAMWKMCWYVHHMPMYIYIYQLYHVSIYIYNNLWSFIIIYNHLYLHICTLQYMNSSTRSRRPRKKSSSR